MADGTVKHRVRLTVGGDRVEFYGDRSSATASLETLKVMLNGVVSQKGRKWTTCDIKDFYLCTSMKRYEYFRMKIELFPEDIIQEYDLRNKVDATGNVHCEVQ